MSEVVANWNNPLPPPEPWPLPKPELTAEAIRQVDRLRRHGYVEAHLEGPGILQCYPAGMSSTLPELVAGLMTQLCTDQLAISHAFRSAGRRTTFAMRKGGWLLIGALPQNHTAAKSRLRLFRKVLDRLERLA